MQSAFKGSQLIGGGNADLVDRRTATYYGETLYDI